MNDLVPDEAKLPVAVAVGGLLIKLGEMLLRRKSGGLSGEQKFRTDLIGENENLRHDRDTADKRAETAEKRANEWQALYYGLLDSKIEEKKEQKP